MKLLKANFFECVLQSPAQLGQDSITSLLLVQSNNVEAGLTVRITFGINRSEVYESAEAKRQSVKSIWCLLNLWARGAKIIGPKIEASEEMTMMNDDSSEVSPISCICELRKGIKQAIAENKKRPKIKIRPNLLYSFLFTVSKNLNLKISLICVFTQL